jgi:hypothetical protein
MTSGVIVAVIVCVTILLCCLIIAGAIFANENINHIERWLDHRREVERE